MSSAYEENAPKKSRRSKNKRNRSTLLQVAQACKVSTATVSRVLNEPHLVKEATRQQVLEAIRQAGYGRLPQQILRPDSASPVLAMIASRPADSMFQRTVTILESTAEAQGYELQLAFSGLEPERELAILKRFQAYNVDAIAFFVPSAACEENIAKLNGDLPPCLFMWDIPQSPDLSFIGIDSREMARNATRYLLSLGHRRIGLVISVYKENRRGSERIEGYAEALQEYDISLDMDLISPIPNDPYLTAEPQDVGRITTQKLLLLPERPTAILYVSDDFAMGGLIAVQSAGLSVPGDISIMGMCDTAISPHMRPPLTTIRPPFEEVERLCGIFFEQVLRNTRQTPCRHPLQTELVIRSSCAPPAKI